MGSRTFSVSRRTASRLLTANNDHTILVWDMRLQSVPLPNALGRETDAAKLWETLASGKTGRRVPSDGAAGRGNRARR